ncbi:hypothetical protein CE139_18525 [Pseudomonas oryzihabitans]|uniref:Uncharacterized protein n=2 Tax=Pseudomonas oryzihabitans TaxID=47885 RepID=A0A2Z5AEL8_9PSED|nr:hypothetical protein CE139_18525 [Pseudomonas oryzihabitans]
MSSTAAASAFDKDAYLSRLAASRARVRETELQLRDWLRLLKEHASKTIMDLEPLLYSFPQQKGEERLRLVYDIHVNKKRYGNLGIAMRSSSSRTDLCNAVPSELMRILHATQDSTKVKQVAAALKAFNRFNARVGALKGFGIGFPQPEERGPVVHRWLNALETYGEQCIPSLEKAFAEFDLLSSGLDDAMLAFNLTMGRIRYRAIRCTYTVDDFDPLGPSCPMLKVVVLINKATGQRRYNEMTDFKKALKRKRIAQELKHGLGRDPEKSEVEDALRALRPRKESEWITKEVIKACYFGRSINQIFEAQENLVAVMQPWTQARNQLRALLP